MIWLAVTATLVREVVRALTTPARLLAYLPRRHHWRRVANEVLQGGPTHPAADAAAVVARLRRRKPGAADRGAGAGAPRLFVSAGEASGEAHAARLVTALRGSGARVAAFGGQPLRDAGADVRFGLSEHAVMGLVAVLRQLPLLVRAYATFLRLLRDEPPDLVVLVDYPGLHLVMAKACRQRGVPVLHYVAPQYWAWGPWRMRRYRRSVDATLTILPFEPAFFRRFAVAAHYVGHPLLDELDRHPPAADAVAAVRARRTLCLLPGSRRRDIEANLAGMLRVARALQQEDPDLRVVVPHRDPRRTELIRRLLAENDAAPAEHHECADAGQLAAWLAGAHLTLAKSGTGSLEACLHGNPVVVVYQLRGVLSTLGYHNILSVPFIAAANLVAGRRVVPEHCFHDPAGWDRVLASARALWRDGPERARCREDLRDVRVRLGTAGATARVARIVDGFFAEAAP